jgi:DNA-binding MarR family transcriptional regulator
VEAALKEGRQHVDGPQLRVASPFWRHFNHQFRVGGELSLTQLRVLGILRDREPTMAELATYMGLERSTVSGLIDRAVQRGLVRKDSDPADGRSVRVSLATEARRLERRLIAEIGELLAPLTDRLTAARLDHRRGGH